MCKNATSTASSLMVAIRPTLVSFLTLEAVPATEAATVLAAYDTAQADVANWTPGTAAQTVVEAVNAADSVFQTLPVPEVDKALAGIISAGFTAVIAVIEANSPAAVPADSTPGVPATPEEAQAAHVVHVVTNATAKVATLVPGFKHSIWTSPAHQYKNEWNKAVAAGGARYAHLKQ